MNILRLDLECRALSPERINAAKSSPRSAEQLTPSKPHLRKSPKSALMRDPAKSLSSLLRLENHRIETAYGNRQGILG